ncbi:hypothetical protein J3R30DRAFT_1694211 [Lentinula aciculospora]|uniref:Pentacotripeptide-repeat region of PRORP domain-containing protein n=1 Tax=Lentinula aciculospora TaxID=153920 RepID=A0A9W8ZVS8_9AGAR|nr:hypothetical protein J3R30DRAFT_1694211 [Lentinula aciculospora]
MLPLPKVAYATSRVVTTFGQSPTIRNALHLQSSPSPSSSKTSSPGSNYFQQNKGSSKPLYNFFDQTSGGSKGSRFTHGYLGASRVVTQVQPLIVNDTECVQGDDNEEVFTLKPVTPLRPQPRRYRSHSLSSPPREHGQKLSVLSTVQLHARSKHAFSQALTTDDLVPELTDSTPSTPPFARRNSTTSINRPDTPLIDTLPPLQALPHAAGSIDNLPSNIVRVPSPPHPPNTSQHSEHYLAFIHARSSGDHEVALLAINNFRSALAAKILEPSIDEFNAAFDALYHTRSQGSPLTDMQDLYNTMISYGVHPDVRTYTTLIYAHCDRDYEVVWALKGIEQKLKSSKILNPSVEHSLSPEDHSRRDSLAKENNFSSAVSLFQVFRTLPHKEHLPLRFFSSLLSCCAHYGAVDVAIMVWETVERHSSKPSAVLYKSMIQTFARAGELNAAEDVFADFREQSAAGKIAWGSDNRGPQASARAALRVWNVMIEAYFKCGKPDMAIGLLQEMLEHRQSHDIDFRLELPSPAPSTYTTIITGFCNSGDHQSAMTWFNTLITQSSSPGPSFDPCPLPSRPDALAYRALLETLSQQKDMLPALNTVWSKALDFFVQDGIDIRLVDRCLVAQANLAAAQSIFTAVNGNLLSEENLKKCSEHIEVACSTVLPESPISVYVTGIWEAYFNAGLPVQAMDFALRLFNQQNYNSPVFRAYITRFAELVLAQDWAKSTTGPVSLGYALTLLDLMSRSRMEIHPRFHLYLMQQYYHARGQAMSAADLSPSQVKALCVAAATLEMVESGYRHNFAGLVPFMEDLIQQKCDISLSLTEHDVRQRVFSALMFDRSVYQVKALLEELGLVSVFKTPLDATKPAIDTPSPSISSSISNEHSSEAEPDTPITHLSISSDDLSLSTPHKSLYEVEGVRIPDRLVVDREVTRKADRTLLTSPDVIWDYFTRNLDRGRIPAPYTLSRICQTFGRAKDIEKVKVIYIVAQSFLSTLEYNKQMQSDAWFLFEDGMIIAMAQAGEIDAAHIHRQRIIERGGAPSADAYGGLILNVKDTTDDTSNSMALFNESQTLRVIPNHYLYNNIISKLAKARKADAALELFTGMKASGIRPSSITYGAVIGACARVGDAVSAEALYLEMVQMPNFKPRIPPFNTMMQLYTTTKPNKDRALFFYHEISKYGVHPTSYTYKLLMEAYALEPLDVPRMEAVFQELVNNHRVELQGTHFATLVNAYGCVAKDLEKALAMYNSIFRHPRKPVVDALVFEAIANVCVAHRRIDLLPQIVTKMSDVGVHMTAYIANAMIKGFAAIGDIGRARELFENLADTPEGIAALHNHAPHEPSRTVSVNPKEPVYREPSTWEAMVRAELGSGTRDRALALIERLESRKYPEAVVNRIQGIMIDHSQVL